MTYHYRILIVDDEKALRSVIIKRLKRKEYDVFEAGTINEGLALCKENSFDAIFLDLKLPDGNGLELLKQVKQIQSDVQIIMLTGHGTIESAIEAMKLGAYDYLSKPCNLSELEITLQKALEQRKLLTENTGLRQVLNRQNPELKIIGNSPALITLLEMTKKVSLSDAPILIQGESGTGKELIARAIHLWSPRMNQAYIPLNCGALPEALIESELFGHEKGAFTGATSQKIGLVEMADRGTLFLDEIGEMPLALQVKLLRFLETGEFRRVGDSRLHRVNVRIVTATNRNLQDEVTKERFRQDLFYRLNAVTLEVPPLRERKEDINPLAEYFLAMYKQKDKSEFDFVLSSEAKEQLFKYDFPGNVRELAHLIKRGQILATGESIEPKNIWPEKYGHKTGHEDVKPRNSNDPRFYSFPEWLELKNYNHYPTLEEIERAYILFTLEKVGGNRAQAAKLLRMSVRNLYRKLDIYEGEE
ncbi:MAG: sigma-54 dependent transcriptional regulator [Desulfitobacterium hafniense]|nr:sigma-54 dependent transcriptional regulator [Desulfitobacterium hafniense]